jgi:hypothetical protein
MMPLARILADVHPRIQKPIRYPHSAAFYSDAQFLLGFLTLLNGAGMASRQRQL